MTVYTVTDSDASKQFICLSEDVAIQYMNAKPNRTVTTYTKNNNEVQKNRKRSKILAYLAKLFHQK